MSGIQIDLAKCVGCKKCEKACAQNGIQVINKKAVVNDNCVMCGICVDSCPVGAIRMEKEGAGAGIGTKDCKDIWVFAGQSHGVIHPVAYELLGKANELAAEKNKLDPAKECHVVALLGEGQERGNRERLLEAGANEVLYCYDERLEEPNADMYIQWICDLVRERNPEIILFGATVFGRELAPGVAVRLQAGLTADCTVLEIDGETGLLRQTRPAFGGNLMATIVCPNTRPQMATVRPGVFKSCAHKNEDSVENSPVISEGVDKASADKYDAEDYIRRNEKTSFSSMIETFLEPSLSPLVQIIEEVAATETGSITQAEIIVDVGRGIGSKKNLKLMREFAELIGGQLGCSRPLVESGWCEYKHQVGQTGSTVSPKILYCIGVSGAIQHLAGIGGAQTIIAINNDPSAPIFGVSNYSVVGDCVEIIKAAVEELKQNLCEN